MKDIDLTEMCNRSADVCGREPIHLSSAIQPHGVLVGLRAKTLDLVTKSANVDAIFGDTPYGCCPSWLPPTVIVSSGVSKKAAMVALALQRFGSRLDRDTLLRSIRLSVL